MNIRVWIKSALAAALGVHCFASLGQAQSPADRTTLARAIELVEAHLDKANGEANPDLKRRMQVEAYLAMLSLPSTHRPYEAADRLRVIDEALAQKPASTDREVIEVGLGAARTLAEERDDLQRIFLLDRQYSGLSSGEGVNKQYFLQLEAYKDFIEINQQNIEAARENLRLQQEKRRVGSGTELEVTQAQVELTRAQANLVNAEYEAKIARARLETAMGAAEAGL